MTTETNAAAAEETARPEETGAAEETTQQPITPETEGQEVDPQEQETKPEEPATEGKDAKPNKQSAGERIAELTKNWRTTERERDYWKNKAQAQQSTQNEPEVQPRPKEDDFENYDEFQEALTEWKTDQIVAKRLAERDKQSTKEQQKQAEDARLEEFTGKIAAAKQRYPDYDAIAGNPSLRITDQMLDVIQDLEDGAEVIYQLGKHPEMAADIAQINSPHRLAYVLHRFEEELGNTEDTSAPETQTTTPPEVPPDPPVTVGGGKPQKRLSDGMSVKDWMARRNQEASR